MIRKFLFGATAWAVCSFAAAFSAADLSAQLQKPANIQGSFVQQRFLKSLDKPMTSSGRFVLKPKQGLLWQVHKPFELQLRVRRDGISQWDAKNRRWLPGRQGMQSRQVGLFMGLLGGDMGELQKQFETRLSGSAGNWQLVLLPKGAVMKQIFKQITVSGSAQVQRVELEEKQGERTLLRFDALQTDQTLSAEAARALQ